MRCKLRNNLRTPIHDIRVDVMDTAPQTGMYREGDNRQDAENPLHKETPKIQNGNRRVSIQRSTIHSGQRRLNLDPEVIR
jgi:hypothetical protein